MNNQTTIVASLDFPVEPVLAEQPETLPIPSQQFRRRTQLSLFPSASIEALVGADWDGKRIAPISDLMLAIFRLVERLAAMKTPMPTNPVLAELVGVQTRSSVAKSLRRLEDLGVLRIEMNQNEQRRVHIVKTQHVTGWGVHLKGHSPYSLNPRQPASVDAAQPDAVSRPVVEVVRLLPPKIVPIVTRPALTCQFPLWPDTVGPRRWDADGHALFCGAPSKPGKSWCVQHSRRIYA